MADREWGTTVEAVDSQRASWGSWGGGGGADLQKGPATLLPHLTSNPSQGLSLGGVLLAGLAPKLWMEAL